MLPRSLQWRLALANAALALGVTVVASVVVVLLVRGSESDADLGSVISTAVVAVVAATVIALAIGYLLSRRTSRSVRSVTEGARRLSGGDLSHRVESLTQDETLDLADAFNNMASTLRSTIQNLSSERNKLSAILETMADGVVMVGPDGGVELVNQVARELLEIDSKDVLGRSFMELARDHELHRLVSRSLETNALQFGEVEHRPRRFVSAIAIPLGDDTGRSGAILTLHDLTRVRRLDTTRREFVSNVSHELRNPLASIKAAVETLQNGALSEPDTARNFLQRIDSDLNRMITMSDELLELSRLESGQAPIHLYPIHITPLLREVQDNMEEAALLRGVRLTVDAPDSLPPATGDGEKIRQVLVNLVHNAMKFTPGGGTVSLRAESNGENIKVEVSDTGVGISPDHLPHVFERFYKVDRSRRDEGTGLGLAIVKHIVQFHGGDVDVESEERSGSTFSFTIPRAD